MQQDPNWSEKRRVRKYICDRAFTAFGQEGERIVDGEFHLPGQEAGADDHTGRSHSCKHPAIHGSHKLTQVFDFTN